MINRILFTLSIASLLLISSCKKEQCNCGLILDDNAIDYSIKVRNDCTMNEKWFVVSRGDWMNAHVGTKWCFTNISSW